MWPTLTCLWLALSGEALQRPARRRPAFRRPSSRPRLEALEDRCLLSVGFLDPTFNPTGSTPGIVTTGSGNLARIAIQSDGKIVEAVPTANAVPSVMVERFNVDGSPDTSFHGTGTVVTPIVGYHLFDLAIQPDGKIVVAGSTNGPFTKNIQFALARYTTTGAPDLSFGQQGSVTTAFSPGGDMANALVIQPDGKIVLTGYGSNGVASGIGLARFNSNGSLDGFFGSLPYTGLVVTPPNVRQGITALYAKDVAIDSAGRLVVAESVSVSTGTSPFVARYNSDGSLDKTLGGTGIVAFPQLGDLQNTGREALQTDGKIVLVSGTDVIRVNPDGSLDTASFGPLNPDGSHAGHVRGPGGIYPSDVRIEADGKIIVAAAGAGAGPGGVVRLLSDGSLDPSFGTVGLSQPISIGGNDLAIRPADGNIVVAGRGGLARFVGDTPTPATASTLGLTYYYQRPFNGVATAGLPGTFTVWADNAVVGLATSYTGTVHFTSSDPQAVLPADYTFTATDHGAHTFSATFKTAGIQSLTATDTVTGSLAASETGIVVNAAAASHFSISAPASVTSGVSFSITVTALDPYGNVAVNPTIGLHYPYTGTVHVTSSDASATLPPDYTFLVADKGVHTFTGLVLSTKGVQTLTITDVLYGTIFGSISVDVV